MQGGEERGLFGHGQMKGFPKQKPVKRVMCYSLYPRPIPVAPALLRHAPARLQLKPTPQNKIECGKELKATPPSPWESSFPFPVLHRPVLRGCQRLLWALRLQQLAQKPQVQDLELFLQVHAHDAVLAVDAQEDTCGFPIFPEDHLHLGGRSGRCGVRQGEAETGVGSLGHAGPLDVPRLGCGL